MSNVNDNNHQMEGTPVSSPQGTSRNSREASPERSTTHNNEQHGNEQIVEQDAAFVRGLPVVTPTPLLNNIATVKIPQSGFVNSGNGGTPNESRDGRPGVDFDKYLQQPWKPSADPLPIPKKFKMLDIPKYDGTTDPRDHVTTFTTGVKSNNLTKQDIESVLVKKFGETLTKGALTWYSLLPKNSIDSFDELADLFIKAHSGAQKVEKRMEDIFKVNQGDTKLLREFVDRFQRERILLPRVPDNWVAMAFASNLNEKSSEAMRRLKESLREFPATTWDDVYNSEKGKQAYIKNRQEPPKPLSPKRTVNVINGGEEVNGVTYTTARKITKFTITHGKRTRQTLEGGNITFDDADTDGLMIPHNDALVISLLIPDTNVKRVLIDPGNSENIILLRVVNEILMGDHVVPKSHSLFGFDNSTVVTKGEIELSIYAEGVIKETNFQVIDTDMAYNVILGRSWIHAMDVVPSTLHQVIKFPSKWGI
ncbi:uncharacterized protein LOC142168842 [Nicotiana tabacum]|uniref:Uncharacterized protein LOC142168842 n=1 Tax=Nicotiana tabacum TaxID=4097 RepID=A0AC58SMB0_TOBAC